MNPRPPEPQSSALPTELHPPRDDFRDSEPCGVDPAPGVRVLPPLYKGLPDGRPAGENPVNSGWVAGCKPRADLRCRTPRVPYTRSGTKSPERWGAADPRMRLPTRNSVRSSRPTSTGPPAGAAPSRRRRRSPEKTSSRTPSSARSDSLSSFRGESTIDTWFFSILVRTAQNQKRWQWLRGRRNTAEVAPEDQTGCGRPTAPSPLDAESPHPEVVTITAAQSASGSRNAVVRVILQPFPDLLDPDTDVSRARENDLPHDRLPNTRDLLVAQRAK